MTTGHLTDASGATLRLGDGTGVLAPAPTDARSAETGRGRRRGRAAMTRWARIYWKPLAMFAAARFLTVLVLLLSRYVQTGPVVGGNLPVARLDRFAAWDGGWYIEAARHGWPHAVPLVHGYPAFSTLAFFPMFPLAIRAVAAFGIPWIVAGVLADLVIEAVMVVLVWQLLREVWGGAVADRGTLMFLFFPGALAFALIYSEPLLLAAAAGCMLALRRRWWVVAGLAAAVGTATRPVGVALVACCAWEALQAVRARQGWRPLLAPLVAPLGIVTWMAYLWAHTGQPFIWGQAEKAWDDSFDPLTLVTRFIRHETDHSGHRLPYFLPVIGFLFCVGALVLLVRARPPAMFVVYSAVVVAIAASSRIVGLRPRLIETAFPLVVVFGYWLKDQVFSTVLAMSAVALGALLMITLTSGRFVP